MIRAKKIKLIKVISLGAALAVGVVGATLGTYYSLLKKYNSSNVSIRHDRGLGPSLVSNVKVVIKAAQNSNTDSNLKPEIYDVTTTILFKYNDMVVKRRQIITKSNEKLVFDVNSEIPDGYVLDPEKYTSDQNIEITPGSTKEIFVVPQMKTFKTTLTFFANGEEIKGSEVNLELHLNDQVDISKYIPKGYEIVPGTSQAIVIGVTNRFQVQKKVNEVTTELVFINSKDNKNVFNREITQPETEPILLDLYIPSGYQLDVNNPVNIKVGELNKIYVVPVPTQHQTTIIFRDIQTSKNISTEIIKTIDDQKITLDQIKNLLPNPQYYQLTSGFNVEDIIIDGTNVVPITAIVRIVDTTFNFTYNDKKIQSTVLPRQQNALIPITDLTPFQPFGYTIAKENLASYLSGNVYNIKLDKIPDPVKTTTIVFQEGTSVIKTETIKQNQIKLSDYVPEGYELVDKNFQVKIGENNVVAVTKIQYYVNYIYYEDKGNGEADKNNFISNSGPQYFLPNQQPRSYTEFVPSGYIVKQGFTASVIPKNQNFYIPVIKNPAPEQPKTTIINYVYMGQSIKETPFITTGTQTISDSEIRSYAPRDTFYNGKLVKLTLKLNNLNIKIGQKNDIELTELVVQHKTIISLSSSDGYFKTFSIITNNNDPVKLNQILENIPEGYKLENVNEVTNITPGETVGLTIVKKNKSNQTPSVKPPVNDADSNKSFTGNAGANATPVANIETPSTNPIVPKANISADTIAKNKANIQSFIDVINKGNLTAAELRPIIEKLAPESLHLVEAYADFLNGTGAKPIGIGDDRLTPEQRKNLLKISLEQALNSIDSEAKAGRVPVWHFGTYNLGPNFGYPSDDNNPVIQRDIQVNKERAFANGQRWPRTGADLLNGDYKGWTKSDISGEDRFKNYITNPNHRNNTTLNPDGTISTADDSIRIYQYTPDASNTIPKDRNPKIVVDVNATNQNGLNKLITLLNGQKEIYGLTIRDIGAKVANQDLAWIYKQIPSNVKKLTLIFSSEKTTGLSELKNHRFDEIELVADINNNDDKLGPLDNQGVGTYIYGWGIDPIMFKNTKIAPKNYNPVKGWDNQGATEKTAGGITFNIIRPDKGSTLSDVNEGFKIALHTKRSWKIFNGNWGDEGFPIKIDLSLTKLTSLKGINLYNKYFKVLKLHSDNRWFTIDGKDLGQSQFEHLEAQWAPNEKNPKVFFDRDVDSLRITGNAVDLTNGWNTQLYALMHGMLNSQTLRTIYVDNQKMLDTIKSSAAYQALGSGVNVEIFNNQQGGGDEGIFS
ncbi:putative immunoglobulin-blocking virulence protein [Mycoplasma sp. NEAQ87857]|uniref:putative immunoglobulin-blocking virulence protein n=1 Tax=Mycoplasma sp. NEAQ87857 TaxID=2683967 RepID=UPI0013162BBC|nr:putative immunoglobulin-blocking virulence protein [Mycoplasma sp. NEAQ87857]QGZ97920.1 putative immunoglobulin-blocking virulence protein [Mycoplasma sp. NEAQ87857]